MDSNAAISHVELLTKHSYRTNRPPEDIDYVTAIWSLHQSLGLKLTPACFKGHQDKQLAYK